MKNQSKNATRRKGRVLITIPLRKSFFFGLKTSIKTWVSSLLKRFARGGKKIEKERQKEAGEQRNSYSDEGAFHRHCHKKTVGASWPPLRKRRGKVPKGGLFFEKYS